MINHILRHVETMARAVAEGASKVDGAEV
ncbi:NAD(P)H:quinone oxidoreductase, partial [Escherichia coli]